MKTLYAQLLSGVSAVTTGNKVESNYFQNFTFSAVATGALCSGVVTIQTTVDRTNWLNLFSGVCTAPTGFYYQFNGPWQAVRSKVEQINTGTALQGVFSSYILGMNIN